jgi:putative drug exporter of the RND superfamily
MASLLYRLGKTAYRRWPLFLALWLAALIGLGTVAATMAKPMSDSFSIPGIASEKAADLQSELFPESVNAFDQAAATVVVAAPKGHTLTEPAYRGQVDALVAELASVPQMPAAAPPANPVDAASAMRAQLVEGSVQAGMPKPQAEANAAALLPLSPDGRVGLISWNFDVDTPTDVKPATQEAVAEAMAHARQGGLQIEANGTGLQAQPAAGGASELLGVGVALVVLVLSFGSLVSAGLPLLTAMIGIGVGITGITAMTAFTDVSSSTTGLATMIGLAVGIDYALFILAR